MHGCSGGYVSHTSSFPILPLPALVVGLNRSCKSTKQANAINYDRAKEAVEKLTGEQVTAKH